MANYQPIPVTARILAAREQMKALVVPSETNPYVDGEYRMFCTGDRFITPGFLKGWLKNKRAKTTRLRRSLAEAAELYAAQPVIYENDLLAGRLYLPHMNDAEQKDYQLLCQAFDECSCFPLHYGGARKDHIALDFEKLLQCGVGGVLRELKEKLKKFSVRETLMDDDYGIAEKEEFCECCIAELEAVLDLAHRYADRAEELAWEASGKRRRELLRMSAAMRRVPEQPAETFFEAIQSVHFFLSNLFGLFPFGRPDRYLFPYYEKDLTEGRLTQEEAQELIDFFCLGISDRVFSRAACGFMVGGQTAEGALVENDLTYMFLTALDHVRLPDPNGALCVTEQTGDDILEYAAELLGRGVTHPAFFNDTVIVSSLRKLGIPAEEAVNYIHSTCAEITVSGATKGHTTAFGVNLPAMLLAVVSEHPEVPSMEELMRLYAEKIRRRVIDATHDYEFRLLEADRNGSDQMRICCFVNDCVERCKGLYGGGAKYAFIEPVYVGFATAVDSFVALKMLCFDEKRLTPAEFLKITADNFRGQEPLRQYLLHRLPHYGNDDDRADTIAAELARLIRENSFCVLPNRKYLIPGTFSYVMHADFGAGTQATFDGRLEHVSYSDGCCPVQGRDTNGPTAMIRSLTSWDQSLFLAGMVVNVKFSKSSFNVEKRHLLVSMIRGFMERGGIEMQINSVDRATLEDARIHPEDHGDLLVRIGGYSDYFIRLNPILQQEIIERTEY